MRRSEVPSVFLKFKELHERIRRVVALNEEDPDFASCQDEFRRLFSLISENLELFSPEEKEYFSSVKAVIFNPRHRFGVVRARTRSNSLSSSRQDTSTTSDDASYASSESLCEKMGDKNPVTGVEGEVVKETTTEEESTTQLKALQLRLEAQQECDELEHQQELLRIEMKRKMTEKKRALLKKAETEGLDASFMSGLLADTFDKCVKIDSSSQPPQAVSPTPNPAASTVAASAVTEDRLLQILGSQRLKNATPKESDLFSGNTLQYPRFLSKFKTEVLDVEGVTDSERFSALQDRTRGEARDVVDTFVYLKDKSEALKEALASLEFYYAAKKGSAQAQLTKITEGKEVSPNSVEEVKGLLQELEKLVALSTAMNEADFLELDPTVLSIVKKRFSQPLKLKFADKTEKAEEKGEKVNVAFVIKFLKGYFKSINRTFGMGTLSGNKTNPPGFSSTPTPASSSSAPKPPKSGGSAKASVAAVDVAQGQRKPRQSPRQWNSPQQQQPSQQPQPSSPSCIYCSQPHLVDGCTLFSQLSHEAKKDYLYKQLRCFRCFDTNHRANACKAAIFCNICNATNHHTLLHNPNPASSPNSVSHLTASAAPFTPSTVSPASATTSGVNDRLLQLSTGANGPRQANLSAVDCTGGSCFRPIVPAKVNLGDGKFADAYCLIDTGSNRTVVTKPFCEKYGLKTRSEWITLNALGTTSSGPREVGQVSLQSLVDPNYSVNDVEVFVVEDIPVSGAHIARQSHVDAYPHLHEVKMVDLPLNEVSILIGTDLAHSFAPNDVKTSANGVVAFHCPFGWALMGRANGQEDKSAWAAFASFQDQGLEEKLEQMFRADFPEKASEKMALSREDQRANEILEETCKFVDGRYETGLLWKYDRAKVAAILPSAASETTAKTRTLRLAKRLAKTPHLKQQVEKIVQDFVDKGLAEPISNPTPPGDIIWYLPPVVVEEPHKDKPRYCLDCRAPSRGVSLNSVLLTGDGAVSSIYSAIQNARRFEFLAAGDIEGFFHRIALPDCDKDAFRFFRWKPENDEELEALRMTCNIFGSACSSTNATYALRQNAIDHGKGYPANVIEAIYRAYVDDVPTCAPSTGELISLGKNLIELCAKGGFNLIKFISNSRDFLSAIPEERRAKGFKDPDGQLPQTSFLGLTYDPQKDTFSVKVLSKKAGGGPLREEPPQNRREVLSVVMGIFDPIGFVCPFVVVGKKRNQRLCSMKYDWDAPLPPDIQTEVAKWFEQLLKLSSISIPRFLRLTTPTKQVTLHVFTDASPTIAYGAVAYFVINESLEVSWVSARSRVSPDKETNVDVNGSTPRIELQAAVAGIELATQIKEEIAVEITRKVFHTDSTTVYWWIQNRDAKYKVFVANRLNKIHLATSPSEWHHVPTNLNPADVISRGANVEDDEAWSLFHNGPNFLRQPEEEWPPLPLRDATVGALFMEEATQESSEDESVILSLLRRKSSFYSAKRILCYVLRFIANCKAAKPNPTRTSPPPPPPSVDELRAVEKRMILDAQRRHFGPELDALKNKDKDPRHCKRTLNRSASVLRQLQPFVDEEGFLRVGGRLGRSDDVFETKHPIILPYFDSLTNHFIYQIHEENGHAGIEFSLAESRRRFWIIKGRAAIKKIVWRCLTCRKKHRRPEEQRMADLPAYRINVAQPFTDTAVDLIGPYQVKQGRASPKCWIVIFVCMRIRAVFMDVIKSLEAQVFIDTLQRFHSHYPTVERLYSDQGTNFVGARNVLAKMLAEWKETSETYLTQRGIVWSMIPPHAANQGGAWERIVGVVKKALPYNPPQPMDFEKFRTLVIITAGIVNRRPLTRSSSDPNDLRALTPLQFVLPCHTVIPSSNVLPAGPLSGSAMRRSQDSLRPLVDDLWARFKSEYVSLLQRRTKWLSSRRNLAKGDLVLVIDELFPREHWPMAVVIDVFPGDDGLVRRVRLKTGSKKELERDVRKIVLLEREGEGEKVEEIVHGGGGDGGGSDGGGED